MASDLAIARLAFAQSTTSVDALVRTATLRLQVAAAQDEAGKKAAVGQSAAAPLDALVGSLETIEHVDKKA